MENMINKKVIVRGDRSGVFFGTLVERNVNFDDMYTVDEFIAMCENSYGGEIIKKLKEMW